MDWSAVRDQTMIRWRRVLDGIGERDALTLIAELNEIAEICEQARLAAGYTGDRCSHCAVFRNARECADARWRITDALLDGELDEARAATMAIVAQMVAASSKEAR